MARTTTKPSRWKTCCRRPIVDRRLPTLATYCSMRSTLRCRRCRAEQRSVFIAHEWEGHSFKELSTDTGVSMNTLLSRKRYAVLYLRRRLRSIYEEFVKK